MNAQKITKSLRLAVLAGAALIVGFFVSIKSDDASRRSSIRLDFDTERASADVPPVGTSDGTATGTADSSDSGSGSSDCGSGSADGAL